MVLNTWTPEESIEERKDRERGGGYGGRALTRIGSGLEETDMETAHGGILWLCSAECEVRDRMIGWQILYLWHSDMLDLP